MREFMAAAGGMMRREKQARRVGRRIVELASELRLELDWLEASLAGFDKRRCDAALVDLLRQVRAAGL